MKKSILFFLLFSYMAIHCQSYKSIIQFDSSNGLKSDIIYSITEDTQGYIWIATDNGVAKFNGTAFKYFQKADGLPSNDIITLIADKKNRIWLSGFYEGLFYIENNIVKKVAGSNGIKGLKYAFEIENKLYFTNFINSESYVLDKSGCLKRNKITHNKQTIEILNYNPITKEYIALIAKKRINCILNKNKKIIKYIPKKYAYCPSLIQNENCFIYEASGMKPYNLNRTINNNFLCFKKNLFFTSLKDSTVNNTFQLLNNEYNTTYNIYLFNNKKIVASKNNTFDPVLSKRIEKIPYDLSLIHVLFIDRYNNFWIIDKSNRLTFLPYYYDEIKNYSIKEILENDYDGLKSSKTIKNYLYFLTSKKEFYRYNLLTNKKEFLKVYNNENPYKILYNNSNKIIVACNNGFDFFKENSNKKIEHLYYKKTESRNASILNDTIFYTKNNSVYKLYNKESLIFTDKTSIRFNYVYPHTFYNTIVANEEKIVSYDVKTKLLISNETIHNTNVINSYKNLILIGTNFNGLFILDNKLNILKKIFTNLTIYKISKNKLTNKIYIGTNEGLFILNEKFEVIDKIDNEKGLIKGKVNSIDFFEDKTYCSTKNGLSIINYKINNNKISKSKIEIDNIYNNNIRLKNNDNFILERKNNNITIATSIFNFNNKSVFTKKYLLVKENSKNQVWTEFYEDKIAFRELAPGNYKLKIVALESKNSNPTNYKTIHFTVKHFFWESITFKISIIITALLISLFIILYVKRRTERKYKRKIKLHSLELKALKAQMNPHFIFNALNNFQSILIMEGIEKSNTYLSKFSSLIRATLEIVNNDIITLNEELEYINKYTNFEVIKNPDLNVIYNIDRNVRLDKIKIPVMLLQPIVENAILHGLSKSNEKKQLTINVKNNFVERITEISIEDNGIGINQNKIKKDHKSFGTSIIKERINMFNFSKKNKIELKIENLNNVQNNPGTKVTITIPYNFKY